MTGPAPLVHGRDLSLIIKNRPVFTGLSFRFGPGLSAISGTTGSGRSSLLLALVGRMSRLSGRLEVAGLDAIEQARRLRKITSVARISTMIDLEPQLSVAESVTERALIDGVPTDQAHLRMVSLEERVDHRFRRDALIGELDAYTTTMLAACLAALRPAELSVLDDVDSGLTLTEQRRLLDALGRLPEPGSGIVVSTREPAAVPRTSALLRLPTPDRID